jgi:hypothetical protein
LQQLSISAQRISSAQQLVRENGTDWLCVTVPKRSLSANLLSLVPLAVVADIGQVRVIMVGCESRRPIGRRIIHR